MHEQPAADRIARVLGRPVAGLHLLGRGADHDAYAVDDALVALVAREPDASAIEREVRLLQLLAERSPLPVPTVVAHDAASGIVVTTRLRGTSLLDRPIPQPRRLAGQLADLLGALHDTAPEELDGVVEPDDYAPSERLAEAAETVERVAPLLTDAQRALVERFVESEAPVVPARRVLCHNDLGAEHILVAADGASITGVIDWSDAALADDAIDLGRLYRDLGPDTVVEIVERVGLDRDPCLARAAFYARCTLLEDLDYGLSTGDHRYRDRALEHLGHTFDATAPGS